MTRGFAGTPFDPAEFLAGSAEVQERHAAAVRELVTRFEGRACPVCGWRAVVNERPWGPALGVCSHLLRPLARRPAVTAGVEIELIENWPWDQRSA